MDLHNGIGKVEKKPKLTRDAQCARCKDILGFCTFINKKLPFE